MCGEERDTLSPVLFCTQGVHPPPCHAECNAHCWLLSSENVEVPTSPRRERAEGSWEVGVLSPRRRGSVMSRASVESSFSVVSSVPSTPR